MATATTKPVKRVTETLERDRGRLRRVIVSIGPGDVIGFRYERTRLTYMLTVRAALQYAQTLYSEAERKRKAEARKARKAGGR